MSLGAEKYDGQVFEFLAGIMSRNDERPTVIIMRSDHGLQGGPYPVDYSTQIEHMHPWTAIIVPELAGLSVESLATNQDRLVTGFDIYNSMRSIMDPASMPQLPPWSYNLFRDKIPSGRNCIDARIPSEFCPCNEERVDLAVSTALLLCYINIEMMNI